MSSVTIAFRTARSSGHVAGHDGDGPDVDVWIAHGEQQRDGVVGGRVGVDDHTATIWAATIHPASLPTNQPESRTDVALERDICSKFRLVGGVMVFSRGVR